MASCPLHNVYPSPSLNPILFKQWLNHAILPNLHHGLLIQAHPHLVRTVTEYLTNEHQMQFENNKIYSTSKQKIFLLSALKELRIIQSRKGKMNEITGLHSLQIYCTQYGIKIKQILKKMLIEKYDEDRKIIVFRQLHQTQSLINQLISQIQQTVCGGDIALESPSQNHPLVSQLLPRKTQFKVVYVGTQGTIDKSFKNITLPFKITFQSLEKRLILRALKDISLMHGLRRGLKKLTVQKISQIKAKNTETLGWYFHSLKEASISNKIIERRKNLKKYLSGYGQIIKYEKIKSIKLIRGYMDSFLQRYAYQQKKRQSSIKMIKSAINRYICSNKVNDILMQRYLQEQYRQYEQNQQHYKKVVHAINSILMKRSAFVAHGIQTYISLISIESYINCAHLQPQHLLDFFTESLSNKNCGLVKIVVRGAQLQLTMSDGTIKKIGHNTSSKEVVSDNNKFIFFVENDGSLFGLTKNGSVYVKGDNKFGQLGLGQTGHAKQFTKLNFHKKIKLIHSGGKKTVAITTENQIYICGTINEKEKHHFPFLVKKPKYLIGKKITGASCTHSSIFIQAEGQIYELERGMIKSLKKEGMESMLISTGNRCLEVTYLMNLRVNCYDSVKQKSIRNWFQKRNSPPKNQQRLLDESDQNNLNIANTNHLLN